MIYEIDGIKPVISSKAFIHDSAVVIGDVIIEEGVFIGPTVSIRGDFGRIIIKKNANIQDGCILHGDAHFDTVIEEYAHVGHGAVLHTCIIKKNALIGMNAVILNEAIIGENAIIGALALVPSKAIIPDNHLAMDMPAKVKRELSTEEIENKSVGTQAYIELTTRCLNNFKACEPLSALTPERNEQRF